MANVTITDVGPCRKQLTITVPQADIQKKLEESYAKLAQNTPVPGFRLGHTPRKLLEKRFGEEVIEDVKQNTLAAAADEAIQEHNLKALGEPSFDKVEFAPDKDCVFEMTIEVEPSFELGDYKGLAVKRKAAVVTPEEIEQGLESIRLRRARLQPMPADTAVIANDMVLCDWAVTSEGETVADQKATVLIANGRRTGGILLDKDLAETLAGVKAGEQREFQGKFMDDYTVEKWRGKPAAATVTVQEVRRPMPPELNEEFAKAMDFDSVDDLKKAVEQNLQGAKERQVALNLEEQIFDLLLAAAPFDLPQGVLKTQARHNLMRQQYRLRQRGIPQEEIEKHLDEIRSASEDAAQRNLKIYFILNRIAEKEKIFVTETEVDNRIAAMAAEYRMTPQKMRQHIEEEGSLSELRAGAREDKVMEFLLKNAKVEQEA